MMGFLRRILGLQDIVFIIHQHKFTSREIEGRLRQSANDYISKNLNKFWGHKIEDSDHYDNGPNFLSILTTFHIRSSKKWGIFMYELYAFSKTLDLVAFKDYEVSKEVFTEEDQEVVVYKIKI